MSAREIDDEGGREVGKFKGKPRTHERINERTVPNQCVGQERHGRDLRGDRSGEPPAYCSGRSERV